MIINIWRNVHELYENTVPFCRGDQVSGLWHSIEPKDFKGQPYIVKSIFSSEEKFVVIEEL